jgi:hypothetical protein
MLLAAGKGNYGKKPVVLGAGGRPAISCQGRGK